MGNKCQCVSVATSKEADLTKPKHDSPVKATTQPAPTPPSEKQIIPVKPKRSSKRKLDLNYRMILGEKEGVGEVIDQEALSVFIEERKRIDFDRLLQSEWLKNLAEMEFRVKNEKENEELPADHIRTFLVARGLIQPRHRSVLSSSASPPGNNLLKPSLKKPDPDAKKKRVTISTINDVISASEMSPKRDTAEGELASQLVKVSGSVTFSKFSGYYYLGQKSEQGKREGVGTLVYPDGSIFYGNFVADLTSGLGLHVFSGGDFFFGDFSKGKMHGFGYMKLKNTEYWGQFAEGEPEGRGLEVWRLPPKESDSKIGSNESASKKTLEEVRSPPSKRAPSGTHGASLESVESAVFVWGLWQQGRRKGPFRVRGDGWEVRGEMDGTDSLGMMQIAELVEKKAAALEVSAVIRGGEMNGKFEAVEGKRRLKGEAWNGCLNGAMKLLEGEKAVGVGFVMGELKENAREKCSKEDLVFLEKVARLVQKVKIPYW